MNKVLREEKKFLISVADFIQLSHKVEQVMLSDSHNGTHGYAIRSLYFDTPFDDDYQEKQAGVELRRKYVYGVTTPLPAMPNVIIFKAFYILVFCRLKMH